MTLASTIRSRFKFFSLLSLVSLIIPWASFALVGELAIGGIMILAAAISSKVLAVAAQFASAALDPRVFFGQGYLSSTIVQVGWGFVLSFTNAFFIFILLIIGFATIFRYGGYTMKETLGKLVIAALLINFSLVIAGLFIDGSNLLAEYFIQASGNKDFGGSIVNQLGLTPGGQPDTSASSFILSNIIPPTWAAIQGLLIQTVFNLVAAFILALIGIMFVIRTIMIWVLLILSPIVWLAWVLPKTATHWDKWWDEFLKWCFFAPIATFFLFLAMTVGTGVNTVLSSNPPDALTPAYFTSTGITNFLVTLGLMILSLTMAQKHAGVGGDMVKSLAGWGAGAIKGAGMKFSGANMVGRYGKAIQGEFKKNETEKQEIAKGRVKDVRGAISGKLDRVGLGNLTRSPKEQLKHEAEERGTWVTNLLKKYGEEKTDRTAFQADLERIAGNRNPLKRKEAADAALALAKLQKPHKVTETEEVEVEVKGVLGAFGKPATRKEIRSKLVDVAGIEIKDERINAKADRINKDQEKILKKESLAERLEKEMKKKIKEEEEAEKPREKPARDKPKE